MAESEGSPSAIVLVHGIGGPVPDSTWITPLNATLTWMRTPTIDLEPGAAPAPGSVSIVNVDYLSALRSSTSEVAPANTWPRPDEMQQAADWGAYLARREHFRSLIEGVVKQGARLPLADFPPQVADSLPHGLPIVRRYLTDEGARHAVWQAVIDQLPDEGRIVIVAHSLGSVVMLDLLTRLPSSLQVSLLLTIGSPVGIGAFRERLDDIRKAPDFPTDRVGAWVNAYDPDDIVTAGRGAAPYFDAALDAPVETGLSHGIAAYMSQPLVGAAVATALFGPPVQGDQSVPARRIHPNWWPLILRFAFTNELWRQRPTQEWATRIRMDTARRILAQRAVAHAQEQRDRLTQQVAHLPEPARALLEQSLADQHFAAERMPTEGTLLRDASEVVSGQFSDEALILSGVDLMLSPPFAPFEIEVDHRRGAEALASLFQRICRDDSARSGAELGEVIAESVDETRRALSKRGIPWAPVLLGAGALVLAGTGIGLAAAIPAGLAGAAAVTATLAAFGPGGIAGGVATLAVLSGTSAALATAGLALGGASREDVERLQVSMAEEIAHLATPTFRTAIAGLLAVHLARHRLGLDSRADALEFTLSAVQGVVLGECTLHLAIAPKSDVTKQWRTKAEILVKAREWSETALHADQARARTDAIKAIESGEFPVRPGQRNALASE